MSVPTLIAGRVRAPAGDRGHLGRWALVALAAVLVLSMLASVATGAAAVDVPGVLLEAAGLAHGHDAGLLRDRVIVFDIRLPRMLMGVLVGAGLAVSGAILQGLFRNPLADPGLVGVSSGAGLGAVLFIVLGDMAPASALALPGVYGLPVAAFAGGLVSTGLLYLIATRGGQTAIATLLLAGIALGALTAAVTGLLIYGASDTQLRDLTFWSLGSLAGADWGKIVVAGPVVAAALALALGLSRGLNALALGEATAHHLGVPVQRLKTIAIVCVAAATGAAVASSGGIGFVGIVVPHLLRLGIGPDHRYLLPASGLFGAVFLLLADMVSRTVVAPAELPIGIVTAMVGGPFFLWVLLRRRGGFGW